MPGISRADREKADKEAKAKKEAEAKAKKEKAEKKAAAEKKAIEDAKPKTVKMYRSKEDAPKAKKGKKPVIVADVNEKEIRNYQKKGWSREKFD